jgi:hypothetical protein
VLARQVACICSQNCPASTWLSFIQPSSHVVAANITALVHQATKDTKLVAQGYDLKRIGTHSLRALVAMALQLQDVVDSLIMKIGRWTGLTF